MNASLFDRRAVREHRRRAARGFAAHDFLHREVAGRLADRLLDLTRRFPLAVGFGARGGVLAEAVAATGRIDQLITADLTAACGGIALVADDELPPLKSGGVDLVLSLLSLHWVNDLPGALAQINQALAPDGLFLGAFLGGDSLIELRDCLARAEIDVEGGSSPRTAPVAELLDIAGLMQRAGFALPIADAEAITVTYDNAFALMRELRGMGESNAVATRRKTFSRRATLFRAAEIYAQRFAGADGRISATFDIITAMGWHPAATQQKPMRPGSAEARLADALREKD